MEDPSPWHWPGNGWTLPSYVNFKNFPALPTELRNSKNFHIKKKLIYNSTKLGKIMWTCCLLFGESKCWAWLKALGSVAWSWKLDRANVCFVTLEMVSNGARFYSDCSNAMVQRSMKLWQSLSLMVLWPLHSLKFRRTQTATFQKCFTVWSQWFTQFEALGAKMAAAIKCSNGKTYWICHLSNLETSHAGTSVEGTGESSQAFCQWTWIIPFSFWGYVWIMYGYSTNHHMWSHLR